MWEAAVPASERHKDPRRRGPRRVVGVVVVLLLLLLVADRVAVRVADHVLAQRIQTSQHLARLPSVRIGGFPFLTQVLAGRYTHVATSIRGLTSNGLRINALHVQLRGVHLSTGQALRHTLRTILVDHAAGNVQLTYADLNALLRTQGVTVAPAGAGSLAVTGRLTVAGLAVTGHAIGAPVVVPAGVRVTVSHITADNIPAALTALLGNTLTVTIPTTGLPYGLTVRSVAVTTDGLDITADAAALTLPAR